MIFPNFKLMSKISRIGDTYIKLTSKNNEFSVRQSEKLQLAIRVVNGRRLFKTISYFLMSI